MVDTVRYEDIGDMIKVEIDIDGLDMYPDFVFEKTGENHGEKALKKAERFAAERLNKPEVSFTVKNELSLKKQDR